MAPWQLQYKIQIRKAPQTLYDRRTDTLPIPAPRYLQNLNILRSHVVDANLAMQER